MYKNRTECFGTILSPAHSCCLALSVWWCLSNETAYKIGEFNEADNLYCWKNKRNRGKRKKKNRKVSQTNHRLTLTKSFEIFQIKNVARKKKHSKNFSKKSNIELTCINFELKTLNGAIVDSFFSKDLS